MRNAKIATESGERSELDTQSFMGASGVLRGTEGRAHHSYRHFIYRVRLTQERVLILLFVQS